MLTRKERRALARQQGDDWRTSEHNKCASQELTKHVWYSNAQWPEGTYPHMNDLTHDYHDSFDAADGVCGLFMTDEGSRSHNGVQPIKTWVTRDKPACEGGKEYVKRARKNDGKLMIAALTALMLEEG